MVVYFLLGLKGFLLSLGFIFILEKLSLKHKLLMPKGIPLVGGIGLGLSFILVSWLFFSVNQELTREITGIITASGAVLVFGILDDWRELSVWAKFLMQILATSILIFFGVRTEIVYIGNIANLIITYLWVLGITNAFNHLDVTDGLAGGVAIIVSCAFLIISLMNGDIRSAILFSVLIGVLASFLLFNLPPARIYMGNAGSHLVGFILSSVALVISYAPLDRKIALLSPLLILGLPIFDTTFLVLIRLINKNLPFNKSNDHLVLRLSVLGYSKRKNLVIMLGFCLFFCLCGIACSWVSNYLGAVIVILAVLVSLVIGFKMSKVAVNG